MHSQELDPGPLQCSSTFTRRVTWPNLVPSSPPEVVDGPIRGAQHSSIAAAQHARRRGTHGHLRRRSPQESVDIVRVRRNVHEVHARGRTGGISRKTRPQGSTRVAAILLIIVSATILLANKVEDLRVQGSGFKGSGFGCRFQGSEFSVQGSGFRVQGSSTQG